MPSPEVVEPGFNIPFLEGELLLPPTCYAIYSSNSNQTQLSLVLIARTAIVSTP